MVTADNGEEALTLALSESPAAVLLDLMMPKMDGFGFLNALRSTAAAGLPVIVTGALADRRGKRRRLPWGLASIW